MPESHSPDIDLRGVAWGGLVIVTGIALALGAAALAYRLARGEGSVLLPSVAGPGLQSAPQPERAAYFAAKERALHSYGWVDRAQGRAHIPIDEAMRILSGEPVQAAGFAPQRGAALPLQAEFTAPDGRALKLGALFGGAPVLLVPQYYRCRTVCSPLFETVLQSLAVSGLAPAAYRLVGVSIDPADTPAEALVRQQRYRGLVPGVQLLTGQAPAIGALTQALGYRFEQRADGDFVHPAALVIATPDGRIASSMTGMVIEPAALRRAIQRAARPDAATDLASPTAASAAASTVRLLEPTANAPPAVAAASGISGFVLLCLRDGGTPGGRAGMALWAVRIAALGITGALAALLWRLRRRP